MNRKPKSNHAHVLMSGHNAEHSHHKNQRSHGASSNAKPSDILMRQHHFHGGIANMAPVYAEGGRASKKNRFATGGHVDHESTGGRPRKRHADGGEILANTFKSVPQNLFEQNSGGPNRGSGLANFRNQFMMAAKPTNPIKKPWDPPIGFVPAATRRFKKGGHCYAEGGETKNDKGYGEKPLTGQLRKGGRAMRRSHHNEGEAVEGAPVADNSVREERRKGGSAKRQHHYWGQNVIGRLPLIGGLANSISNTVGTLDPHKYGGAEYVARTKGQKAADIFSTIGNLGANVALSAVGKKSKGGEVHHRAHHAAGGSGKIRKGMMTKSGRMIHSDI